MSFVIQGGRQDPTLEFDVTDASSGVPARVTILSGVLALAYDHGMLRVERGGSGSDPRQPMGFFVPGSPNIGAADPVIVPELSLAQVGVYISGVHGTKMHGVGDVAAQMASDPQRGGQRSVYVTFSAVGADAMVVRYRVSVYRPRG